jgi:glycine/D-amino acid oxidase-like deaminating enzyme
LIRSTVVCRFERLTGPQIRARFPQWTVPDDMLALYQADGGLVDAAMGIAVHVQLARSHGATTVENCKVLRIEPETGGTTLVSSRFTLVVPYPSSCPVMDWLSVAFTSDWLLY